MSRDVVSDDAVAALVDAARRADLPADDKRAVPRRGGVRKVDFTRPAKFSAHQERRLARLLDTFCRTASTRLAAELRMPVELELINTAQLTWANAHAQIPEGSICATLAASPIDTRMLLSAELEVVIAAIDRLLGGTGDLPSTERKLTEIDLAVARLFFSRLLTQLSAVFNDAARVELELESLDSRIDTEQLAGVSEPTLAATVEVRHDGKASTLALLLPYAAFAPVADAFTAAAADGMALTGDPEHMESAVAEIDVVVQAEVAAVDVPIEAVLAIAPGDMLRLGGPASAGVALTIGGQEVARGMPGRSGHRRAVQVVAR